MKQQKSAPDTDPNEFMNPDTSDDEEANQAKENSEDEAVPTQNERPKAKGPQKPALYEQMTPEERTNYWYEIRLKMLKFKGQDPLRPQLEWLSHAICDRQRYYSRLELRELCKENEDIKDDMVEELCSKIVKKLSNVMKNLKY